MSFGLHLRLEVPRARFCRGVIAMLVCCVSWSRPIKCDAQTATDEKFAAHKAEAEEFFRKRVTPFIKTYCIDCHQNRRPTEAGVNFSPALKSPGHAAFSQQWKKAAARVKAHDMPPEGMEQPTAEDRQMFSEWLAKIKKTKHAEKTEPESQDGEKPSSP